MQKNRIAITFHHRGEDVMALTKPKIMVPDDMMMMHVMCVLRRKLTLPPHKALFLFTSRNRLVPATSSIAEVFQADKSADDVLHITYATENAFG